MGSVEAAANVEWVLFKIRFCSSFLDRGERAFERMEQAWKTMEWDSGRKGAASKAVMLNQKNYVVFCESQSALDLSKNTMYHTKTKHIDVRYHWLHLMIEEQHMLLKNVVDMLTKILSKKKLELCSNLTEMSFLVKYSAKRKAIRLFMVAVRP
ncbi:uncharacterized protein LOC111307982 [Durio zibethinus]|uniref:Uncharacterized protein LOC111307982 n=1 Tax=Durio zibethinus TaxID=66656 RepID=A0A6P6AB17_DURZI|nr:uncharacterized protein LOC111307982 [Durio zibethinus]